MTVLTDVFTGLNEVDYSHYPDRAFQLQWLRSYLEAYNEHKGQGGEVTDREVEIIYVQVNRFALVSICIAFWSVLILLCFYNNRRLVLIILTRLVLSYQFSDKENDKNCNLSHSCT